MSTNKVLTEVMNNQMEERLSELTQKMFSKTIEECTDSEVYNAVLQMTKEMINAEQKMKKVTM